MVPRSLKRSPRVSAAHPQGKPPSSWAISLLPYLLIFCIQKPSPPNPAPRPPFPPQGPTLSKGIYLESRSMSKEIVQLRELFQNISGSQWTSYLSASTAELRPSPSCPHCFLDRRPLRVCRRERHILAPVLLSGPHSPVKFPFWCRIAGQLATGLPCSSDLNCRRQKRQKRIWGEDSCVIYIYIYISQSEKKFNLQWFFLNHRKMLAGNNM